MGFNDNPGPGVTPGRTSVVTLDVPTIDSLQEPAYWHELSFEKISPGDKNNPPKVVLIPEIGWQLASYNSIVSYVHEGTEADDGILSLTTPSGFSSFALFRRPDDLNGVGGGGLKLTGDEFFQKRVGAGDDWGDPAKYSLQSDQSAYPSPDSDTDNIPMDRIGKSDTNHLPTEKIYARFYVPGLQGQAKQTLVSIYFSGISGRVREDSASGTGQYCLKLYGDGQAKLFERLADSSWAIRKSLRWTHSQKVVGAWHFVTIVSDARFDGSTYVGTKIGFQFQSVANFVEAQVGLAVAALGGPDWQFYKPRRINASNPVLVPVRLDCRRDVRACLQISKAIHFPEGPLVTHPFALPFVPMTDAPLRFEWYGDIPSGTSIDVALYRADSVGALTVADPGAQSTVAGHKSFNLVQGVAYYVAVINFTASVGGAKTPTIQRIRLVRERTLRAETITPTVAQKVDNISITGPSADPTHETAGFLIHDRRGSSFPLFFRSGGTIRAEVKYDPEDEDKTSTLFLGRVLKAPFNRRPRRTTEGFEQKRLDPIQKEPWRSYKVQALGEWTRLASLLTPRTYDFSRDPAILSSYSPYKVTDIIRILLESRYPSSMVDVPDLSTRLFVDEKQSWLLEVYTEILPIVQSLARDYLGGYLIFDPNATNGGDPDNKFGCWRLLVPPRPPYKNLAEFVLKPNFEGPKNGMNLNAYVAGADGLQEIKTAPAIYGTMRPWVIRPECNYVFVQGATPSGNDSLAVGSEKLQAEAYNYKSAWFNDAQTITPDPNHPDYIDGGVYQYIHSDPGLQTPEAVKFACRRIYDIAAHAQKRIAFSAPLVLVTDIADTKQLRPRKLQFGDPVLFEGQQFIIDSCDVDYAARSGGDRVQLANYEVFNVPALQNYDINLENAIQAGIGIFSMAGI